MAQKIGAVRCYSAEFAFDDSDITISIPDGWRVYEVVMDILTEFNLTMTATVGYTSDTDAFLRDADVTNGAVGIYYAKAGGAAKKDGYTLGASQDVVIDITRNGAASGDGVVYVYAHPCVA